MGTIIVYFMMGFMIFTVLLLFIGCTAACIRSCMIDVPTPPPTKPVDVPPMITIVIHPDHRELSLAK